MRVELRSDQGLLGTVAVAVTGWLLCLSFHLERHLVVGRMFVGWRGTGEPGDRMGCCRDEKLTIYDIMIGGNAQKDSTHIAETSAYNRCFPL